MAGSEIAAGAPPGTGESPLRLLVVRPALGQGGADRVTLTLLRALDRSRFRASLALVRARGELLTELPADVEVHDLGGGSLWTAWWPLTRLLRRLAPDVVLSTSGGTNMVAALAHRLCRRPMRLVLSERNVLYRDQGTFKRWLQVRLKRLLYRRADCLTAVSRGVAADMESRLGIEAARVRVIYNPVVTPRLPALAAAESPDPWLEEETPVLLGVGRLVPAKGFDLLLEAFAELRHPARLILLGEGPQRGDLLRLAHELGVEKRVRLAGFDPNPFRYMARCSVFVLSSRFEGLPGALIQAMACGAAVVAADCPTGPAEILEHEVSGFLVPLGDRSAMVARIDQLLEDPELRGRLAAAAVEAAQRFSLAATLHGYEAAITGIEGPHSG